MSVKEYADAHATLNVSSRSMKCPRAPTSIVQPPTARNQLEKTRQRSQGLKCLHVPYLSLMLICPVLLRTQPAPQSWRQTDWSAANHPSIDAQSLIVPTTAAHKLPVTPVAFCTF